MQQTHVIRTPAARGQAEYMPHTFVVDRTRPGHCRSRSVVWGVILSSLEWVGAALGIAGAALLAMNNIYSGWGWFCFLGSNLAWITYGKLRQVRGLVAMNIAFTATSFFGLFNWHYQ